MIFLLSTPLEMRNAVAHTMASRLSETTFQVRGKLFLREFNYVSTTNSSFAAYSVPFLSVITTSVGLLTHTNGTEESPAIILYFSFMQERRGWSTAFDLCKFEGCGLYNPPRVNSNVTMTVWEWEGMFQCNPHTMTRKSPQLRVYRRWLGIRTKGGNSGACCQSININQSSA